MKRCWSPTLQDARSAAVRFTAALVGLVGGGFVDDDDAAGRRAPRRARGRHGRRLSDPRERAPRPPPRFAFLLASELSRIPIHASPPRWRGDRPRSRAPLSSRPARAGRAARGTHVCARCARRARRGGPRSPGAGARRSRQALRHPHPPPAQHQSVRDARAAAPGGATRRETDSRHDVQVLPRARPHAHRRSRAARSPTTRSRPSPRRCSDARLRCSRRIAGSTRARPACGPRPTCTSSRRLEGEERRAVEAVFRALHVSSHMPATRSLSWPRRADADALRRRSRAAHKPAAGELRTALVAMTDTWDLPARLSRRPSVARADGADDVLTIVAGVVPHRATSSRGCTRWYESWPRPLVDPSDLLQRHRPPQIDGLVWPSECAHGSLGAR